MNWGLTYIPGFEPNMSLVTKGVNIPIPIATFVANAITETGPFQLKAWCSVVADTPYRSSTAALLAGLGDNDIEIVAAAMAAMGTGMTDFNGTVIQLNVDTNLRASDPAVIAARNASLSGTVCRLWLQTLEGFTVPKNFFVFLTDSGGGPAPVSTGSVPPFPYHIAYPIILCNTRVASFADNYSNTDSVEGVWNLSNDISITSPPSQPAYGGTLPTYTTGSVTWFLAPFYPGSDPTFTTGTNTGMCLVAQFDVVGGAPLDYGTSAGGESSLPTDSSYPTENAPYLVTVWDIVNSGATGMTVDDLHVAQTVNLSAETTTVSLYMKDTTAADRVGNNTLTAYVYLRDNAGHELTVPFHIVSLASPVAALSVTTPGGTSDGTTYVAYDPSGTTLILTGTVTGLTAPYVGAPIGFTSDAAAFTLTWPSSFPTVDSELVLGTTDSGFTFSYTGTPSQTATFGVDISSLVIGEFGRSFSVASYGDSSTANFSPSYTVIVGYSCQVMGSSSQFGVSSLGSAIPGFPLLSTGLVGGSGSFADLNGVVAVNATNLPGAGVGWAGFGGLGPVTLTVRTMAYRGGSGNSSSSSSASSSSNGIPRSIEVFVETDGVVRVPYFTLLSVTDSSLPDISSGSSMTSSGTEEEVWTTEQTFPTGTWDTTEGDISAVIVVQPVWAYTADLNALVTEGGTTVYTPILVTLEAVDMARVPVYTEFVLRVYADIVSETSGSGGSLPALLSGIRRVDVELPSSGGVPVGTRLLPFDRIVAGGVWNDPVRDITFPNTVGAVVQFSSDAGVVVVGDAAITTPQHVAINLNWVDQFGEIPSTVELDVVFYADPTTPFLFPHFPPNAFVLEPLIPNNAFGSTALYNGLDNSVCVYPTVTGDLEDLSFEYNAGAAAPTFSAWHANFGDITTSLTTVIQNGDSTPYDITPAAFNGYPDITLPNTGFGIGALDPNSANQLVMTYEFTTTDLAWQVSGITSSGGATLNDTPSTLTFSATYTIPLIINLVQVLMNDVGSSALADVNTVTVDRLVATSSGFGGEIGTWAYNTSGLFTIPATVPKSATIVLEVVLDALAAFPAVAQLPPTTPGDGVGDGINAGFYTGTATTTFKGSSLQFTWSSGNSQWQTSDGTAVGSLTAVGFSPSSVPGSTMSFPSTYNFYLVVLAQISSVNMTLDPSSYSFPYGCTRVYPPADMLEFNYEGEFGYVLGLQLPTNVTWGGFSSASSVGTELLAGFGRYNVTGDLAQLPSIDYQAPDCVCLLLGADTDGVLVGAGSFIMFRLECSADPEAPETDWYVLAGNTGMSGSPTDFDGVCSAIQGPWPERFIAGLNPDNSIPAWSTDTMPLYYRLGVQTSTAFAQGSPLFYSAPITVGRFSETSSGAEPGYVAVSTQIQDMHVPNVRSPPDTRTFRVARTDSGKFLLDFHSTATSFSTNGGSPHTFYTFQPSTVPPIDASSSA